MSTTPLDPNRSPEVPRPPEDPNSVSPTDGRTTSRDAARSVSPSSGDQSAEAGHSPFRMAEPSSAGSFFGQEMGRSSLGIYGSSELPVLVRLPDLSMAAAAAAPSADASRPPSTSPPEVPLAEPPDGESLVPGEQVPSNTGAEANEEPSPTSGTVGIAAERASARRRRMERSEPSGGSPRGGQQTPRRTPMEWIRGAGQLTKATLLALFLFVIIVTIKERFKGVAKDRPDVSTDRAVVTDHRSSRSDQRPGTDSLGDAVQEAPLLLQSNIADPPVAPDESGSMSEAGPVVNVPPPVESQPATGPRAADARLSSDPPVARMAGRDPETTGRREAVGGPPQAYPTTGVAPPTVEVSPRYEMRSNTRRGGGPFDRNQRR